MEQHLELKALLAVVPHAEHSLKFALLAQRHTVYQSELVWPSLLHLWTEVARRQPKVKLHAIVTSFGK